MEALHSVECRPFQAPIMKKPPRVGRTRGGFSFQLSRLVAKEQRGEGVEAAAPGLPFVGGAGGDVGDAVDAGGVESVGGGFDAVGAAFDAAVAHVDELDLGLIGDFGGGDGATAEEADV